MTPAGDMGDFSQGWSAWSSGPSTAFFHVCTCRVKPVLAASMASSTNMTG